MGRNGRCSDRRPGESRQQYLARSTYRCTRRGRRYSPRGGCRRGHAFRCEYAIYAGNPDDLSHRAVCEGDASAGSRGDPVCPGNVVFVAGKAIARDAVPLLWLDYLDVASGMVCQYEPN